MTVDRQNKTDVQFTICSLSTSWIKYIYISFRYSLSRLRIHCGFDGIYLQVLNRRPMFENLKNSKIRCTKYIIYRIGLILGVFISQTIGRLQTIRLRIFHPYTVAYTFYLLEFGTQLPLPSNTDDQHVTS